jgi:antirestriction protein
MKNALLEHIEENQRQVTMELGHKDTAFFIYLDNIRQPLDDLWRNYVEEFEDSYAGYFESRTDFTNDYIDSTGLLSPKQYEGISGAETLIRYFDVDSFGRDLMYDYWETDGHYFRSY